MISPKCSAIFCMSGDGQIRMCEMKLKDNLEGRHRSSAEKKKILKNLCLW